VSAVERRANLDLAVLILDRDISTTYVKIPSNPAPDNRIDIIAGCGRVSPTGGLSDKLRIGTSKITDSTWPYPGVGTSYQHVVGGNNPARPCKGDSGGPLFFVNSDGYWAVHGTIH